MNKNKDFAKSSVFHRINFLYQAAHTALRLNPDNVTLVRFYINCLQTIARKNVLKIDPSIKRTLCKKCCLLLVPGITSTVRMRANRQRSVIVTCLHCKTIKRFPVGHNSKWNDPPQVTESTTNVNPTETAADKNKPLDSSSCDGGNSGTCVK